MSDTTKKTRRMWVAESDMCPGHYCPSESALGDLTDELANAEVWESRTDVACTLRWRRRGGFTPREIEVTTEPAEDQIEPIAMPDPSIPEGKQRWGVALIQREERWVDKHELHRSSPAPMSLTEAKKIRDISPPTRRVVPLRVTPGEPVETRRLVDDGEARERKIDLANLARQLRENTEIWLDAVRKLERCAEAGERDE